MFQFITKRRLKIFAGVVLYLSVFNSCTVKVAEQESVRQLELQLDSIPIELAKLTLPDDIQTLISLYAKTRSIAEQIPDTSLVKFDVFRNFAKRLNDHGGFEESIAVAWKAINVSKKQENYRGIDLNRLHVYGLLASSYTKTGKPDSAYYVYRLAIDDAEIFGNDIFTASALNNLGIFFFEQNQRDSATYYYDNALQLLDKFANPTNRSVKLAASIRDNKARVLEHKRDFTSAQDLFRKNFEVYSDRRDMFRFVKSGISLANAELELGNTGRAGQLLEKAQYLHDSTDYSRKELNAEYLARVYAKYFNRIGNYSRAFHYEQLQMHISDSLQDVNKKAILGTMRALTDQASEDFQNKIHAAELAQQNLARQKQLQLYIAILLAIGILSGVTYFLVYYRQRARLFKGEVALMENKRLLAEEKLKTREQQEKIRNIELENKRKEIAQMALALRQKQDWAKVLDEKFEQLSKLRGNDRYRVLHSLRNEIRSQLHIDKEIETLHHDVENMSVVFYEKLQSQFPDLTKTEIKICSYIRLKLSNAQIAQLQNIDPQSVRVSRYRIKRKLGLSKEHDLDNFLQTV